MHKARRNLLFLDS